MSDPTPAPDPYVLLTPWDRPPLSANHRLHHMVKARTTRQIRLWAQRTAEANSIPALGRCRVELVWQVTDHRRRDAENPVPTLKAICDGLVDAGLVVDDVPEYMEKLMPRIEWADPKLGAVPSVVVVITRLEEAA